MFNFTRICGVFALFFILSSSKVQAQCGIISSTGYNVTIEVRPVSLIKPATCQWGYNYNVQYLYTVSFNGNNIPTSLYTLQGNIYCNGQANFFSLPKSGGSGTATTQSNPWKGTADCASATVTSLKCNVIKISIHGPGIPSQTINCNMSVILPIEIASFNGRLVNNNDVYLNWVTATERNNKTFTVQRSTDGNNWENVATINGAGNSTSSRTYSYTDRELADGMYYYRLMQTDLSGAVSYTNIIAAKVNAGIKNEITMVYSANQIKIAGLGNSSEWEAAVINSASAIVKLSSSIPSAVIDLPNLAPGIYFVKLRNRLNNTEKVLKFFKG